MMLQIMQTKMPVVGFLGMTGTTLRSFGWRPRQVPFHDWKIVKGDQVSGTMQHLFDKVTPSTFFRLG